MLRWILGICGLLTLAAMALVGFVRLQRTPSREWTEFSMGPASGSSLTIYPGVARGNGAELAALVAWVHGFQASLVVGPAGLYSRYSIVAITPERDLELLRTMLRRELETRFAIESHTERRRLHVWVLTADAAPELTPTRAAGPTSSLYERNADLRGVPMATVAVALQSILGQPVVDETGIPGRYDLAFAWGEEREKSLVSELRRKFGLKLSAGERDVEMLVVDRVQPDFRMKVLSAVGRLTQPAHPRLRYRISRALTVR
jgi:uncharacterized protein (TIGR03435 family)